MDFPHKCVFARWLVGRLMNNLHLHKNLLTFQSNFTGLASVIKEIAQYIITKFITNWTLQEVTLPQLSERYL